MPTEVANELAAACRPGPGSILSLPFTSPAYRSLQAETEGCLRRLLAIPDDFTVLFMAGGASAQFAAVPMNLLGGAGEGEGARDTRRLGIQLLDLQRRPDLVADGEQQCKRKAMAAS